MFCVSKNHHALRTSRPHFHGNLSARRGKLGRVARHPQLWGGKGGGSRFQGSGGVFRGRPQGRRVDSRPRRGTIRWHHGSLPYGCPRFTLRRIASSSFLPSARFTRDVQFSGRGIGQAAISWRARSSPLGISTETRPAPVLCPFHQVGPDWIPLDVAQHRLEVLVRLHGERLEPPLVQVSGPRRVVISVPSLCVRHGQPPQALRDLAILADPGPNKERTGIAADGHPAVTPGAGGVECLWAREDGQRVIGGERGRTD